MLYLTDLPFGANMNVQQLKFALLVQEIIPDISILKLTCCAFPILLAMSFELATIKQS